MNKELKLFIEKYNLSISDFYDAQGRIINSCYDEMKKKNKLFAYNTTPCRNSGHKIRDRKNHCIVCNPSSMTYMKRSEQDGNVYIACSLSKQLTKVGMTTESIDKRLTKLNSRKIGNTNDWEVIKIFKTLKSNRLELKTHKILEPFRAEGVYYDKTESKEIFRCGFKKANDTIENLIKEENINIIEKKSFKFNYNNYNFRSLRKR